MNVYVSQCTYRCVVLPDARHSADGARHSASQCTYRCVVLPDSLLMAVRPRPTGLNAPTGAWCPLTLKENNYKEAERLSQCTYRCVVLPDVKRA